MASDVDSKQNEATCSNKTKPKYKPVSGRLREHLGWHIFSGIRPTTRYKKRTNYEITFSVCLSVCDISCGRNSHLISMKIYMVVWNPKSNIEFIRGQNPTTPSQIFHPHNALSMARSEHHSLEPCGQIVAFDSSKDASRRLLYWQCCNLMCFSHKLNVF